jgi:uncharacterized protein
MTETSLSTGETTTDLATLLSGAKYVSLESFKRDGSGVTTPVWFVVDDRRVYCRSGENTYKIKRMRRNPSVTVAPCNFNGEVSGPRVPARVEFVPESKRLRRRFLHRYPVGYGLEMAVLDHVRRVFARTGRSRPRGRQVFYELLGQEHSQ